MTATTTGPRQELISFIQEERQRTKRVLDAFPASASELKPHPTCGSTREVVHTINIEAQAGCRAVDGTLDMSKMGEMPKVPATWAEVLAEFDKSYDQLIVALEIATDEDMSKTLEFMTGPKQMSQVPRIDIVKTMMKDHIHHRGQLSVYLRMSGSKVPSIYGPSKDEPWN